ncbi:PPE family protein, partial [Rhodococcus sp. HNM0569]|nr:PPE family protein [Rhodococcus sp. HNM0569]
AAAPEGWGRGAAGAPAAGGGAGGFGGPAADVSAAGARGSGAGTVMGPRGAATGGTDSDDEHDTPEYLKNFEHFADGRTVIPSVIGGAPDPRDAR